jgi:hypothetical protein
MSIKEFVKIVKDRLIFRLPATKEVNVNGRWIQAKKICVGDVVSLSTKHSGNYTFTVNNIEFYNICN